jgi:VanZ family protein
VRRFLPPAVAAAVFILWAPFIGEIRNLLKAAFPRGFAWLVAGVVVLALVLATGRAVGRIRERRAARYRLVALAVLAFAWYVARFRTGNADVDAVELFHFLEYGLMTWLFYRAVRPAADLSIAGHTVLFGLLVGSLEEWLQWLLPTRVGDVRDVFLNLYAVGGGLLVSVALDLPSGFRPWPSHESVARMARFAAAVMLVFGGFFHSAHLGYEIHDEEVGRFRSYFARERLPSLSGERAAQWRRDPPRGLKPLGREDYYLTERGGRAQLRNEAYTARDFRVAWSENRILEKYYDPFLDLRSFSSGALHRWPVAQRAEVEAGRPADAPDRYVSRAGANRIYIRPSKPQFWSIIAVLVASMLVLGKAEPT